MFLEERRTRIVVLNNTDDHKKSKAWLIVIIVLSCLGLFFGILAAVLRVMARRRAQRAKDGPNIDGGDPSEADPALVDASTPDPPRQKEHPYYNSDGYEATQDQNHTLLGNDERPPVTRWDSDSDAVAGVQRPESIASSYNAPPPRYD